MPKKKSPRSLEDMFSRKPGMFPGGNGKKETPVEEAVEVFDPEPEDVEAPSMPPKPATLAAKDDFLSACGDGFELTAEQAKFEIREAAGRMLDDYIRIGKRLFIVKAELEHGQFMAYMDEEFPLSYRVGAECMLIARRLMESKVAHVRNFYQLTAGNSNKKALLLMGVSDDEILAAQESNEFLGKPLEEVGELSYRQLKEVLRKTERDRDRARQQRDKAESKNEDLTERIAVLNADEEDLEAPLTPLETEMGRLMHQLGRVLNVAKATDEEELEHDGIGYFALIMNKLDALRETLQPFGPPEVPFEHGKPEEGD